MTNCTLLWHPTFESLYEFSVLMRCGNWRKRWKVQLLVDHHDDLVSLTDRTIRKLDRIIRRLAKLYILRRLLSRRILWHRGVNLGKNIRTLGVILQIFLRASETSSGAIRDRVPLASRLWICGMSLGNQQDLEQYTSRCLSSLNSHVITVQWQCQYWRSATQLSGSL